MQQGNTKERIVEAYIELEGGGETGREDHGYGAGRAEPDHKKNILLLL